MNRLEYLALSFERDPSFLKRQDYKKEFALLEYFLLNQEKVVSQEELIEHVWDQNTDSFSGVIRVHIAILRKKLKALLDYDFK